jgi:nucleoside-diphosphate-sugar epimerase
MKVLVVGATGALGLPLVRELAARGHEVAGTTRSPGKRALIEQVGARAVVVDAFDAPALERAAREFAPTHVVHMLTALPKNGPMRAGDIAATNRLRIEGTANVLRAAVAAGARRIVAESFSAVYGYNDHGARALVEDDSGGGPEATPGLQAVVDALQSLEEQLLRANAQGQIEAVVLRYGLTYGPENPSTVYMLKMLRKGWLPVMRGDRGIGSFIHIDDAAAATIAALERGRPGAIYNIVDDEPVSFSAFVAAAAGALGARRPPALPGWLLRLIAPALVATTTTRLALSNERARRELGWQPRFPSYREGLAQIARAASPENRNSLAAEPGGHKLS